MLASHIVQPHRLGFLMNLTVLQDIQHRRYPGLNPSSSFDFDEAGYRRVQLIRNLALSPGTCLVTYQPQ